jgi:DNA-directed RNA polymerase specialized sigma subunit
MKTVIWLVKVKGLAQDEVARRLNISQQRFSVVLKQTIEKLRKSF